MSTSNRELVAKVVFRVVYAGRGRTCSVCGKQSRRFAPYRGRPDAMCPRCLSLERHRLLADHLAPHPGATVEIAPRGFTRALVTGRGGTYVGVDLVDAPGVDIVGDVTALPFEDDAFRTVICSHVLEHVPDDRAAVSELARILDPQGTAYIMFPHDETRAETYEDASITEPAERERVYGQEDHVRIYGRDRLARLEEFFAVTTTASDDGEELLYICKERRPG